MNAVSPFERILPPDWDRPSNGNENLCRAFGYGTFSVEGIKLPYRFFEPPGYDRLPLVVYLHGADAVGDDNEIPLALHDIGTMFVRPDSQRDDPCFVLAPQYGTGMHWTMPPVREAVLSLVRELIGKRRRTDPARIYLCGYSAGGAGVLDLLKYDPDLWAAALCICGATGRHAIENLKKTPIWLIHATDDRIVRAAYGTDRDEPAGLLGSRNLPGQSALLLGDRVGSAESAVPELAVFKEITVLFAADDMWYDA